MIVGAGKFVIYRAGHQARGLGKRSCRSHEFEGRIVSSFGYLSLFLLWPSTDWLRLTNIKESDLLYSESTYLNINYV